jgi:hypothetical protein
MRQSCGASSPPASEGDGLRQRARQYAGSCRSFTEPVMFGRSRRRDERGKHVQQRSAFARNPSLAPSFSDNVDPDQQPGQFIRGFRRDRRRMGQQAAHRCVAELISRCEGEQHRLLRWPDEWTFCGTARTSRQWHPSGTWKRCSSAKSSPYSASMPACSWSQTSQTRLKKRSGRMYDFQSVLSTVLPRRMFAAPQRCDSRCGSVSVGFNVGFGLAWRARPSTIRR